MTASESPGQTSSPKVLFILNASESWLFSNSERSAFLGDSSDVPAGSPYKEIAAVDKHQDTIKHPIRTKVLRSIASLMTSFYTLYHTAVLSQIFDPRTEG